MTPRRSALLLALAIVSAACAGAPVSTRQATSTTAAASTLPRIVDEKWGVPDVDLARSSVPVEEVYFDTFDGGAVRLSESTLQLRRRLFDVILPIDSPPYGDSSDGDWLLPDDVVIGYISDGQAYAYPIKILNFHEIVNDVIGGIPVLISYCPLCFSAVVYDRRLDGDVLTFSNTSALFESGLVMVDRETGSYWTQVGGEAIVGTLTGGRLTSLPSVTTTWESWTAQYPATVVLTRDVGRSPETYERDPFVGFTERVDEGRFAFPVSAAGRDTRLTPATMVTAVEFDGFARAYPVDALGQAATNDVVGQTALVLFTTGNGATGTVFSPIAPDGTALTFTATGSAFTDKQTNSTWDAFGRAISGPLEGSSLDALPSRSTFWFAYIAAFPNAEVYTK
jgi:uncharacterized protein DUF3179